MPTYEFTCPEGHDFEKFYRSIGSAPGEVVCPVCGKVAERRLSAGAGLVFKGSGFYITDYGKDGKKDQREAASAASETKSGDSKPGDSKPGETKAADASTGPSSTAESKSASESKPSGDGASKVAEPVAAAKLAPAKPAPAKPTE